MGQAGRWSPSSDATTLRFTRFGSPDVLELKAVPTPTPKGGEALGEALQMLRNEVEPQIPGKEVQGALDSTLANFCQDPIFSP